MSKISKKPYIGTRDFFPEDMLLRKWIFDTQRKVCQTYGYLEYSSPLLESLDLYKIKSSEEIVNQQVYSFQDRSKRSLAIRPEMTPSLVRMLSQRRRELTNPTRWFSIANFMRYERPGHGRLREFFQLNVDILGFHSSMANIEILLLLSDILYALGAKSSDFAIHYSDRRLLESYLKIEEEEKFRKIIRLIDKRSKMKKEEFHYALKEYLSFEKIQDIENFFSLDISDLEVLAEKGEVSKEAVLDLKSLNSYFLKLGRDNILCFDPTLSRGFDYYTGFIFELYDKDKRNQRAILGGGRYDELVSLFGIEPMNALGFGMGDVSLQNFLETHNCIPCHLSETSGVFLCLLDSQFSFECFTLACELRKNGIAVEQSIDTTKKLGKQLEQAEKKNYRYVILLGEEEIQKESLTIKDLTRRKQVSIPREECLRAFFPIERHFDHLENYIRK